MILEKAKALFDAIPNSNPSPKVGALRLYLAALNDLCTWDQMIGFVFPYQIHQEIDSRRVAPGFPGRTRSGRNSEGSR